MYRLKAIEATNATIPMLWESAQQGCAGIGRQLHRQVVRDNMGYENSPFNRWNEERLQI